MRLFRPGFLTQCLYPDAIFRVKTSGRNLFLTFDDGPDPVSTPQLLHILQRYGVKALFFCNGRNAEKYPELMKKILESEHLIGNHSYDHADGWQTESEKYTGDVKKASSFTSDKLFRPPYGHLKLKQYRYLRKRFKIIFWDVMPYDFDAAFGKEKSLKVLKDKIRPGSIIVLHDKPTSSAIDFLDEFIVYAISIGYEFSVEIR